MHAAARILAATALVTLLLGESARGAERLSRSRARDLAERCDAHDVDSCLAFSSALRSAGAPSGNWLLARYQACTANRERSARVVCAELSSEVDRLEQSLRAAAGLSRESLLDSACMSEDFEGVPWACAMLAREYRFASGEADLQCALSYARQEYRLSGDVDQYQPLALLTSYLAACDERRPNACLKAWHLLRPWSVVAPNERLREYCARTGHKGLWLACELGSDQACDDDATIVADLPDGAELALRAHLVACRRGSEAACCRFLGEADEEQRASVIALTPTAAHANCPTIAVAVPSVAASERAPAATLPTAEATGPPIHEERRLVEVFFATNRNFLGRPEARAWCGTEQRREVTYGTAVVSIPPCHRVAHIERPLIDIELAYDERKHFLIKGVRRITRAERFFERLEARVAATRTRSAFVYVHGYNTSFNEALRRAAQLTTDWSDIYDGIPVVFSWPSAEGPEWYVADRGRAENAAGQLARLLQSLAARKDISRIHILAHSMGNRVVIRALNGECDVTPSTMRKLDVYAAAAPDVDRPKFLCAVEQLRTSIRRIVLYASSLDLPMLLGRLLNFKEPLAGQGGSHVLLADGLDTIDATLVDTGILGHSYFGDDPDILRDVARLFAKKAPRVGLQPATVNAKNYWIMQPSTMEPSSTEACRNE